MELLLIAARGMTTARRRRFRTEVLMLLLNSLASCDDTVECLKVIATSRKVMHKRPEIIPKPIRTITHTPLLMVFIVSCNRSSDTKVWQAASDRTELLHEAF